MLNKDPEVYLKELMNINNSYPSILDDFLISYKMTNTVPDNTEYQHIFDKNKTYLHQYEQNLAKLKKNINKSINDVNISFSDINSKIREEKHKNRKYKKELNIIENKENAANELIGDYNNIYKMYYLKNWALFISIFIAGFINYSVYKSKS